MKSALVGTAEAVLGSAVRLQSHWFWEAMEELQPFLVARNVANSRWLAIKSAEDLSKFR